MNKCLSAFLTFFFLSSMLRLVGKHKRSDINFNDCITGAHRRHNQMKKKNVTKNKNKLNSMKWIKFIYLFLPFERMDIIKHENKWNEVDEKTKERKLLFLFILSSICCVKYPSSHLRRVFTLIFFELIIFFRFFFLLLFLSAAFNVYFIL